LVNESQYTGMSHICVLIDGTVVRLPIALVSIDTPYYSGEVSVMCMQNPIYDVIIGNIEGARDPNCPDVDWVCGDSATTVSSESDDTVTLTEPNAEVVVGDSAIVGSAVVTRGAAKRDKQALKPLNVVKEYGDIDPKELKEKQDQSIMIQKLKLDDKGKFKEGKYEAFYRMQGGILYRHFHSIQSGRHFEQIVLPEYYRNTIMRLAHDTIMSGHLGSRKTVDRILQRFYWPGIYADVARYCRSCDLCQRMMPKGKVPKVPLGRMPVIDLPFFRIAVDLIGPIEPVTDRKHRYILTMVDFATRYPEAFPLQNIDTISVAEALLGLFSRVGVPNEVLWDQGSQFQSAMMGEVCRLLSMKRIRSSPYHAMCNGLCEKLNGVIKQMLQKLCQERPRDWDRYLPALLFAYREAPQASLGFSPFELLYGRTVRGPMHILKELFTNEKCDPELRNTYEYVFDLRNRIVETCKLAHQNLLDAQGVQKHYYDKGAKDRKFEVGDKVLLLLPTNKNKLLMSWKGPFRAKQVIAQNDYKIECSGVDKIFHANLLKKYLERDELPEVSVEDKTTLASISIIECGEMSEDISVDDSLL